MKERPIIFSGDMVNAIIENRKTVTRRVVKDQIVIDAADHSERPGIPIMAPKGQRMKDGSIGREMVGVFCEDAGYDGPRLKDCLDWGPYGQPGDRLWVRESFVEVAELSEPRVVYRADESGFPPGFRLPKGTKWKPSIHMPRWASRITLEVTGVRVDRLRDSALADFKKEGLRTSMGGACRADVFRTLWDKLNAKRGHSWESNPWVWVVEFERPER